MTRLHIQVNQTMQFYRGQQGGSAPQRLFLSGGASLMPYTAQFFAEKLNVPVEYFNPFRNVQIDPGINLEELARVAHSLGEVVGLGLRNLAHCPVELNLMPESTLNWVQFNQKKPYFIATVFSLVIVVFLSSVVFKKLAEINNQQLTELNDKIAPLEDLKNKFDKASSDTKKTRQDADQFATWLKDRYYWADTLTELHQILISVEATTAANLHTPTGIWIEKFISADTTENGGEMGGAPPPPMMPDRRGIPATVQPAAAGAASTNELGVVTALFRGVNLVNSTVPSANSDIAFAVETALKASPYFDKDATQLAGTIDVDEPTGTFTFGVKIKMKRPLKLP
jgi:hypothetical protein